MTVTVTLRSYYPLPIGYSNTVDLRSYSYTVYCVTVTLAFPFPGRKEIRTVTVALLYTAFRPVLYPIGKAQGNLRPIGDVNARRTVRSAEFG